MMKTINGMRDCEYCGEFELKGYEDYLEKE